MKITCPGCGVELELPPEAVGRHLLCDVCNTKFEVSLSASRIMQQPKIINAGTKRSFDKKRTDVNSISITSQRAPIITKVGFAIIYIAAGIELVSRSMTLWLSYGLGRATFGGLLQALFLCLIVAMAIAANKRHNWARMFFTVIWVIKMLPSITFAVAGFFDKSAPIGLVLLCLLVNAAFFLPIAFLWLPCSNRWYRAKKAVAN